MARRLCPSRCTRNMGRIMYGVKLDSKTEVRDFICQSDRITASLMELFVVYSLNLKLYIVLMAWLSNSHLLK